MKFYINQGRNNNKVCEYGQFNSVEETAEHLQQETGEVTLIWTTFNNDEPITNIKKFKLTESQSIFGPSKHTNQEESLYEALMGIMQVITTDALIPESVSYMKQARTAIAKMRTIHTNKA